MALTNITNLQGHNFTYTEVKDIVKTVLIVSGALEGTGSAWTLNFDADLPGFSAGGNYNTMDAAVEKVLPLFIQGKDQIMSRTEAA